MLNRNKTQLAAWLKKNGSGGGLEGRTQLTATRGEGLAGSLHVGLGYWLGFTRTARQLAQARTTQTLCA